MKVCLTHLSLFTGIGGIDLAAEWAGFQTVGQVEQNGYANRVLRSRFGRTIPRWTDIKDLTADDFRRRTGIDSPTLISGGFPCQPFSCAGKRRGKEDDRHLWPEMFRVVRELRPAWVLGENVAGIVSMELEPCCADLEGEGYTSRAFLVPACGVGAPHYRTRVFILAHNGGGGFCKQGIQPKLQGRAKIISNSEDVANTKLSTEGSQRREGDYWNIDHQQGIRNKMGNEFGNGSLPLTKNVADTNRARTAPGRQDRRMGWIWEPDTYVPNPHKPGLSCSWITREEGSKDGGEIPTPAGGGWWDVEPAVGRVAHGVPHRVDRLRCLGNAVVPQQVYPILAGIAQVEQGAM